MKKLFFVALSSLILTTFSFAQSTDVSLSPAQLKTIQEAQAPGIMLLGNAHAKTSLVEFYDYACPHCRHAQERIVKIQKDHPQDLRLELIPVPLREESMPAEVAALKVYRQDRAEFQKFHDALMTNPPSDLDSTIRNNISDPSMRANLLAAGSHQEETAALIQNRDLLFKNSQFRGVPALIILNKRRVVNIFQGDSPNLPVMVDAAIAQNK